MSTPNGSNPARTRTHVRQRPERAEIFALPEFGFPSLYGHAFCKIARLVDIAAEVDREIVGKELEGDDS